MPAQCTAPPPPRLPGKPAPAHLEATRLGWQFNTAHNIYLAKTSGEGFCPQPAKLLFITWPRVGSINIRNEIRHPPSTTTHTWQAFCAVKFTKCLTHRAGYLSNCGPQKHTTPFKTQDKPSTLMGERFLTNLVRAGLRSVDRNNKATLLLTRPGGTIKSYAKDLSPRMVKLQDVSWRLRLSLRRRCQPARIQGQRPIRIRLRCAGENHRFLAWILT